MAAREHSRSVRSDGRPGGNHPRTHSIPAGGPTIPHLDLSAVLDELSDATSLLRVVHSFLDGKETAGDGLSSLRIAAAMLDHIYAILDKAADAPETGEVAP